MGFVRIVGGARATKPLAGVLASDLAVGSTVKLMEGTTAVEYLVVNQGIPGNSNLYDSSCDGMWVLRKDAPSSMAWGNPAVISYPNSFVETGVKNFVKTLGSLEQSIAKTVYIPYVGTDSAWTIYSGDQGLQCQAFLLSAYELGFTSNDASTLPEDGACLDYFSNASNDTRIAYSENTAVQCWTRSKLKSGAYVASIGTDGSLGGALPPQNLYLRPAMILPKTALFDKTTMILKGVA